MKRMNILAVTAVVVLVGTVGAYADDASNVGTPIMPAVSQGEMYARSSLLPQPEVRPDTMLSPAETPPSGAVGSLSKGPVSNIVGPGAFTDTGDMGGIGSALVTPRGGAMSSPKMKADRQIRQMIKRLD